MPFSSNKDLPQPVQNALPEHGQEIYRKAFNNAYDQYDSPEKRDEFGDDRETTAHKVAWSAVKKVYTKEEGKWREK